MLEKLGRFLRSGGLLYIFMLVILGVILVNLLSQDNSDVRELNSQQFLKAVDNNAFVINDSAEEPLRQHLQVKDKDQTVSGYLKDGGEFKYAYPERYNIAQTLNEANVPFETDPQSQGFWTNLLITVGPILLLVILFIFLFSSMQGGGNRVMSFGKSRAKKMTKDTPQVTFNDVAGAGEAVQELTEIKEFLEAPQKFQQLGARIPKGALLVGPPGTGKTLLARAVAGEAGVPFFSISGSDFVEMFVGVGASRVRDLFEQAKQNAPCIIFMDEIDAVGRQRGAGMGGGHDEREQTLNQLLVEMDGFDAKSGIIMIAATNRPDILDPALLRPGRFDRQITVDSPDLMGRNRILNVHSRGKPFSEDVNLETIARGTPGFTGADLANLVNEAALLAARHDKDQIEMSEMEEAIDRVIAGPERRTRLISDKEKDITAFHESGHAIVGALTSGADPVHKVTIVPRGQALGVTMSLPEQDRFMMSRKQLTAQLAMMLGGRAAERVIFDEVTTGASNDLERVTQLARQMVTKYGMSEKLGPLSLGSSNQQVFMGRDFGSGQEYSDEIAFQIDQEIRRIVDETYDHAEDLLIRNRELLNKLSSELIENETVDADHLRRLIDEYAVDRVPGEADDPSVNGHQEQ
jgi:cell division protease FtsH